MLAGTFSARAYSFFDTLLWIACLNLLWVGFTLLGLGVLGAGPATAAAQILVRRRAQGGAAQLEDRSLLRLDDFRGESFAQRGRVCQCNGHKAESRRLRLDGGVLVPARPEGGHRWRRV